MDRVCHAFAAQPLAAFRICLSLPASRGRVRRFGATGVQARWVCVTSPVVSDGPIHLRFLFEGSRRELEIANEREGERVSVNG